MSVPSIGQNVRPTAANAHFAPPPAGLAVSAPAPRAVALGAGMAHLPSQIKSKLEDAAHISAHPPGLVGSVLKLLMVADRELSRDQEFARTALARASSLLQVEMDRATVRPGAGATPGGLADWQLHRVQNAINLSLDRSINVAELSQMVRLSPSYFLRAFKRRTGETLHAYIVRRRVEQACHLMLVSDMSLSEIGLACGFSDQSHFCRVFKLVRRERPSKWRRERRAGGAAEQLAPAC